MLSNVMIREFDKIWLYILVRHLYMMGVWIDMDQTPKIHMFKLKN
jgi:hypothetical protein